MNGETPQPLPFTAATDRVLRFSPDSSKIWVLNARRRVQSIELPSLRRETMLEFAIPEGAGMCNVRDVALADDARAYAYEVGEYSSRLFQIEGVK